MHPTLSAFTAALATAGQRQLLIMEGDAQWCSRQLSDWQSQLPGDWLWIGDKGQGGNTACQALGTVRTLLGQEFTHAVFDAREGFDVESLAVLAGKREAG